MFQRNLPNYQVLLEKNWHLMVYVVKELRKIEKPQLLIKKFCKLFFTPVPTNKNKEIINNRNNNTNNKNKNYNNNE